MTIKRMRATAVIMNEGRALLVRERGQHRFSLPGGGIERGETPLIAAVREVLDGFGLEPIRAELVFEHDGATQAHHVVLIDVRRGRVRLQRKELDGYRWWSPGDDLPVQPHVRDILRRVKNRAG